MRQTRGKAGLECTPACAPCGWPTPRLACYALWFASPSVTFDSFQIELSEPSGGATFSDDSDGFPDRAVATITIRDNTERRKTVDSLAVVLDLNVDEISLTSTTWSGQLAEAIEFEGGGCSGVFLYLLALPWKLIFALVPPPRLCNGWACFLISLVGIGILTALIGGASLGRSSSHSYSL